MIREIFVFWPFALFFAVFIYGLPHGFCAFPNATFTYNLANCESYNASPLSGVNDILILAVTGLGAFGWVSAFHSLLNETEK